MAAKKATATSAMNTPKPPRNVHAINFGALRIFFRNLDKVRFCESAQSPEPVDQREIFPREFEKPSLPERSRKKRDPNTPTVGANSESSQRCREYSKALFAVYPKTTATSAMKRSHRATLTRSSQTRRPTRRYHPPIDRIGHWRLNMTKPPLH